MKVKFINLSRETLCEVGLIIPSNKNQFDGTRKMGVEFNENKMPDYNYQPKKSGIAPLIIKLGLAKDEAGAQKVMIIIAIICFALSIYFFMKI